MFRYDKASKIRNFMTVLLVHLIKREVEHRTIKSWEVSIRNAVREIRHTNRRRKSGTDRLSRDELREELEEAYPSAARLGVARGERR